MIGWALVGWGGWGGTEAGCGVVWDGELRWCDSKRSDVVSCEAMQWYHHPRPPAPPTRSHKRMHSHATHRGVLTVEKTYLLLIGLTLNPPLKSCCSASGTAHVLPGAITGCPPCLHSSLAPDP